MAYSTPELHSDHYCLFYMTLIEQPRTIISKVAREKWKDQLLSNHWQTPETCCCRELILG